MSMLPVRTICLVASAATLLVACSSAHELPEKCDDGLAPSADGCVPRADEPLAGDGDGDDASDADASADVDLGDAESGADADDGDPGVGGDPGGDPGVYDRIVFVTSGEWSGDLKSAGGQANAVASADALCAAAASGAGLPGTFLAYVSVGGMVGGASVNAIDRMAAGGPWKNTAAELLWTNLQDFIDDWPAVAVRYDEHGVELGNYEYAWTGSTEAGTASGTDCWGFTSNYDSGAVGNPKAMVGFSHYEDKGCGMTMHLYCFQQ